ncbi:MAG: hypothetical protein KA165_13490 [Saprospiraceae bacterium]|nr:hypothetical protein [Saprospiraceae bacterium]
MKINLLAFFGLIVLLAGTGCPAPTSDCPVRFDLNKSFQLGHGATACLSDGDLTIRFDSIAGDSRCPLGVQCIWAGRADAVLTLGHAKNSQTATLSSGDTGQGGVRETVFEGYTIKLESVEPMTEQGKTIEPKDYRLMLTVAR